MLFRDIVNSPDQIMGAKAVFGPLSSHLLCFGGRGESSAEQYFMLPRGVAQRAVQRPYILAIGGGRNVRDGLGGKVLNLARASVVFGLTSDLAEPAEAARLRQWPVALVLHDVWTIEGYPHLVSDLGMADRKILAAAMDGVVRYDEQIVDVWERLADRAISLKALTLPINMASPSIPTKVAGQLPVIAGGAGSAEGRRVWELQLTVERDRLLSSQAKKLNHDRYGIFTCEACAFANVDSGMYDAHHPTPLAAGERTTLPEHLIVLCPTCHRHAHRGEKLEPKSLGTLKAWVESGRR